MMKKKWLLMFLTPLLAAFLITGCNMDNDAPPEDTNDVEDNGDLNNNGDDNLPGTDENVENGPLNGADDENDADPDQEDIIEDPQDTTDENQKDE
jgi:hypothetical protein